MGDKWAGKAHLRNEGAYFQLVLNFNSLFIPESERGK